MISDVLADAEVKIRRYLAKGFYGPDDGDRWRKAIQNLLEHMEAVRCLLGFDLPLDETKFKLDIAAIDEMLRLEGLELHRHSCEA